MEGGAGEKEEAHSFPHLPYIPETTEDRGARKALEEADLKGKGKMENRPHRRLHRKGGKKKSRERGYEQMVS